MLCLHVVLNVCIIVPQNATIQGFMMSQFLAAARYAMEAALDKSLPAYEREQWFETAKTLLMEAQGEK